MTAKDFAGKCYIDTFNIIENLGEADDILSYMYPKFIDDPTLLVVERDFRLVHGLITNPDKDDPIDHAWIELLGAVIDRTVDPNSPISWEEYQETYKPTEYRKFTQSQAVLLRHFPEYGTQWREMTDKDLDRAFARMPDTPPRLTQEPEHPE